jgi:hypothetical protein
MHDTLPPHFSWCTQIATSKKSNITCIVRGPHSLLSNCNSHNIHRAQVARFRLQLPKVQKTPHTFTHIHTPSNAISNVHSGSHSPHFPHSPTPSQLSLWSKSPHRRDSYPGKMKTLTLRFSSASSFREHRQEISTSECLQTDSRNGARTAA